MATQNIRIIISMTGASQASRGLNQMAMSASQSGTAIDKLYRILAAGAVVSATRALIKLSDTYTVLRNRTAVFAGSTIEAQKGFEGLFDVAIRARAPLDATAELYQRLSLALDGSGKSSTDLLRITETVTKAIAISGTTAAEAGGALRQLSQGIAGNRLSGQELNSVLEQTPIIAKLIATELGVQVGQLRNLANKTGAITTEVIIRALSNSAGLIDELFSKTVTTFGQAFEQMKTAVVFFFGKVNDQVGAASALTAAISRMAIGIKDFAGDQPRVAALIEKLKTAAFLLAEILTVRLVTALYSAARAFAVMALAMLANPFGALAVSIGAVLLVLFHFRDTMLDIGGTHASVKNHILGFWDDWSKSITETSDAIIEASSSWEKFKKGTAKFFEVPEGIQAGGVVPKPVGQDASTISSAGKRQATEDLARAKAGREKQFSDFVAMFEEEKRLQGEIDRVRSGAAAELKKDQQAALNQFRDLQSSLNPIIALENQRAEGLETIRKAIKLAGVSQEEANKVTAAFTEELRLQALTIDTMSPALRGITDAVNSVTDSFSPAAAAGREYAEKIKAIGNAVEAGKEINGGVQKAVEDVTREYELARLELDKYAQATKDANEGLIDFIGESKPAVAVLEKYRKKLEEINKAAQVPGVDPELVRTAAEKATTELKNDVTTKVEADVGPKVTGFDALSGGFNAALLKMKDDIGTQGSIIRDGFTDIFSTAGDAVKTFVQTGKLDFRSFAADVISSLAGVIAKLLLVMALNSLAGGSAGGGIASIATMLGGVAGGMATGGPVGPGRTFMVGERGPELFTPPSTGTIVPNNMMGQQQAVNVTVVNVDDPSSVPRAMNTREGEEAILNVISRNRNRVRDSVG